LPEVEDKHAATAMSVAAQAPVPAVMSDTNSLMGAIISCASNPDVDADKVERLLGMYERIKASNSKAAYARALAEMQPELPAVEKNGRIEIRKKDSTGERTGAIQQSTPFALWEDINEAIRPVLAKHGFSLTFRTGREADKISVTAILMHAEGHSEETTILLPIDVSGSKNPVQAVGSSTQYGKRYTAVSLLNITTKGDDDDGKAGGDVPCIDESQAVQLTDLAAKAYPEPKDTAYLIARICKKFGIENTTQMKASDFREAVQLLNDTIASVRDKERAAKEKQGETK